MSSQPVLIGKQKKGEQFGRSTVWQRLTPVIDSSGTASFVLSILLSVYVVFLDGPWQAPVVAAGYWLAVEAGFRISIWRLRQEGVRLRAEIAAADARIAALRKQALAMHAEKLHIDLQIQAMKLRTADLRADTERMREQLTECLIEKARREERARLEAERAAFRAVQLDLMAQQLDTRADQLEERLAQASIMAIAGEVQRLVEEKIANAYAAGFTHGRQSASFMARSRSHLTLVEPTA